MCVHGMLKEQQEAPSSNLAGLVPSYMLAVQLRGGSLP